MPSPAAIPHFRPPVINRKAFAETESGLNFDDVRESFKVKSDADILRALLVFNMCSSPFLVKNSRRMLDLARAVFGEKLWKWGLKKTFFGHFCAGETADDIQPTLKKLAQSGLLAVLDYAAEADVPAAQQRKRDGIVSARTYDYQGEAECDANALVTLSCIESAGRGQDGFTAIKLTALGKPQLLLHYSTILSSIERLFKNFATSHLHAKIEDSSAALHAHLSFDDFRTGLTTIGITLDEASAREIFESIDTDKSGTIDILEWITHLNPYDIQSLTPKLNASGVLTKLTEEERQQTSNMIARLEMLAEAAAKHKVRLLVDAEHTYFQPAIDHMVVHLMRKYNRDFPAIYNTYQCYLRDSYDRVTVDMERARREGFLFAAKIVRGAYMVQERKRAADKGYEDPIRPDIESTHTNYHRVIDFMLRHNDRADVMVATHNEASIRFVVEQMNKYGIKKRGDGVFFGQLLGMCDHVSFSLGMNGYQAYKYVPYGPIHEVLPYLIRRAEENSDMLGGVGKERALLLNELLRRRAPFMLEQTAAVEPGHRESLRQ